MAVGRFQVMAVLQAARAYALGLPEELALSWGLNRAIFYAAAKRGFKAKPQAQPRTKEAIRQRPLEETCDTYFLGDEMAYKTEVDMKTYFTIGGEAQTREEFKRQIEARFGPAFAKAWEEALDIMRRSDREALLSQSQFYEKIYRPRRDEVAAKWSTMAKEIKI